MCNEKKLQLLKNDKAYAFRKTSFWISTGITLTLILAGALLAFNTVHLQAVNAEKISAENKAEIICIKKDMERIRNIDFNIKNLCKRLGVDYIE